MNLGLGNSDPGMVNIDTLSVNTGSLQQTPVMQPVANMNSANTRDFTLATSSVNPTLPPTSGPAVSNRFDNSMPGAIDWGLGANPADNSQNTGNAILSNQQIISNIMTNQVDLNTRQVDPIPNIFESGLNTGINDASFGTMDTVVRNNAEVIGSPMSRDASMVTNVVNERTSFGTSGSLDTAPIQSAGSMSGNVEVPVPFGESKK